MRYLSVISVSTEIFTLHHRGFPCNK